MKITKNITFEFYLFSIIFIFCFYPIKNVYGDEFTKFRLSILNNEVINPLCFSSISWNKKNISLALKELTSCEKYKNIHLKPSENFLSAERKRDKDGIYRGNSYYKVIGITKNGSVIIHLTENGGGTGHFDSVWRISKKFEWNEKTGDLEEILNLVNLYSGGDRCNGGVYDVNVGKDQKGEYINISSKITAFMFLEQNKPSYSPNYLSAILNQNSKSLKKRLDISLSPYDEIGNCALCCSGSRISRIYSNNNHVVNTYELYKNNIIYGDDSELPTQGKYQVCFNMMVKSEINKKAQLKLITMNEESAFKFKNKFMDNCLTKCKKDDQYCLQATVLVCLKGKPKINKNCEELFDTRGPYRSEDECLERVYEIKSDLPNYKPDYEARGYKCELN